MESISGLKLLFTRVGWMSRLCLYAHF